MSSLPTPVAAPKTRSDRTVYEYHLPVMLKEVGEVLQPAPGKLIVDGTLGGGGHTQSLLDKGANVIAIDRDVSAILYCTQHLVEYHGVRAQLLRNDYRNLNNVLDQIGVEKVDGILLDLGTSSRQLDTAERGFSFQRNGPLDMRMDQSGGVSAADLVNQAEPDELVRILRLYGEEPAAARVVAAIVQARRDATIGDTSTLAKIVERVIPKYGPRHPATRVFQGLRIAVNDELGALRDGLEAATARLRPGGRLAVITFHSLEDRIVKSFCRETSQPTLDRPEWPQPRPNPRYAYRAVSRRAIQPSAAEQKSNPRSRSAKLRSLERL